MAGELSINNFLKKAIALGASDEHMIVGQPPFVRVNGFMKKVVMPEVKRKDLTDMLLQIAPQNIAQQFNTEKDIDFIYEIPGVSRFRINYSRRLGNPAVAIRNVPYKKLEIVNVKKTHSKVVIFDGTKKAVAVDDPSMPYLYNYVVTVKDDAIITDDGAVIGGNKIKIGLPIIMEGFKYRINGVVSDVRVKE